MSHPSTALIRYYGEPCSALPLRLRSALPRNKADVASLEAWDQLSATERYCLLPFLLTWLQDYNWPVAKAVHTLLVPLGEELVPFLRSILQGADEGWTYWILSGLLPVLPKGASELLRTELEHLAATPSVEEVDLVAAEALARLA